MTWPSGRDFVESIQNPTYAFSNPNLRALVPAVNRLGMPVHSCGQFAYVFKMDTISGNKSQAVRCFRGDSRDRQDRYQLISCHLKNSSIPQVVSFDYQPDGICVAGARYPVVVMDWLEGTRFDVHVGRVLGQSGQLAHLAEEWLTTLATLRESATAHGDLQHGNIIIANNAIRLVDLDGLWVPAMNGWQATELGHKHFQHPGRTSQDFGRELDNFSGLVIYLSLISLEKRPELWKRFHDENLIFTKADFEAPEHSQLFPLVSELGPNHKALAAALSAACKKDPLHCPSVLDLLPQGRNSLYCVQPWWQQPAYARPKRRSKQSSMKAWIIGVFVLTVFCVCALCILYLIGVLQ